MRRSRRLTGVEQLTGNRGVPVGTPDDVIVG
jgi:hypothetical protein